MITIIFDTETTGLLKPDANSLKMQPSIIEIFCQKVNETPDGGVIPTGSFHSLLKPPFPLTAEITRITGITDEDLENAPSFSEIYEDLAAFFLGSEKLVAHNATFDTSMLANELLRIKKVIQFPWPREHVCTVEKSLHVEQRRLNLQKLHEHLFGLGFKDAHRAESDVKALVKCYSKMKQKGML